MPKSRTRVKKKRPRASKETRELRASIDAKHVLRSLWCADKSPHELNRTIEDLGYKP